jgi:hypothetical protein
MAGKFEHPAMLGQLDDDYLRAIGRVASAWASLEWTINWEIRSLYVHPEVAPLRKDFLRKEFKARAIFWREQAAKVVQEPQKLRALIRIIERAVQAHNDRNWVVHGAIRSPLPPQIVEQLKLSPATRGEIALVTFGNTPFEWKIRRKSIDLAWIERLANKITQVHADLLQFAMVDLAPILKAQEAALESR